MTELVSSMFQNGGLALGVACILASLAMLLAAVAWRMLIAERKRHSASRDLAAKLNETTTSIQRTIGVPLHAVEENLRFVERKTDDIVATVTAFQRLYAASRDFTVTPELLFELKDLTQAVDSRELIVELPERVRQSLKEVSSLSAMSGADAGTGQRADTLRVVAGADTAREHDVDDAHIGNGMMESRVS